MKERLDVILLNKGLAPSREKAKTLIMEGIVYVDNQKEDKAGSVFDPEKVNVEVRGKTLKYVSRGGLKLEKAMDVFDINVKDMSCLDIGASTGGFTDVMLQNGAKKVYAVDVGFGQLDWKLRNDGRVVCMEKLNFRYADEATLPEKVSFAATDVSFISLSKILPPAFLLLNEGSYMVCLIKPQFEAGKDKVGKKGVVRDKDVHIEVIENVCGYARNCGFTLCGLDHSPICGAEGNIEYLLYIKKPGSLNEDNEDKSDIIKEKENIRSIVDAAFLSHNK
ncbi:MAG TPA: TlyA family rRNA (cytidine-2'-O)-methyltransferase [Lachnospiraceae bacterium]|nr:TlyA family rRNA (cytidine-2'-O)-methyltransferase [Lachnospiraceae bacterium]